MEKTKDFTTAGGANLRLKVSEKGGVSLYGLGRFPVTLYYEQWVKVLDSVEEITNFVESRRVAGELKLKDAS